MTQDEFLLLLRKQAGAPEADSLAEKTLVTAWRMAQAGDSESIKNAENILNFATVEPVIKNIVKQQFQQVAPATITDSSTQTLVPSPVIAESVPELSITIPTNDIAEKEIDIPVEAQVDSPIGIVEIPNTEEISEAFSIPSDVQAISEALPLDTALEPIPVETVQVEPVPAVDPVATILNQSSVTTPATQTQKKESPDDIVSKILANTENRKLSRAEEFEQLIKKTKQEEVKKDVELEKPQAVIHTYDTAAVEESEQKYHSVEDRVKADKAEPYFAKCEEYLKKAYQNGAPSIIVSAESQLASLKTRFPEFLALYPDRVEKIEALKLKEASKELDTIDVSGAVIKKGMTITSSHIYEVNKILEQGSTVMFHFSDEISRNYKLSSVDLARGLETPGIDADVFFDEFRVN